MKHDYHASRLSVVTTKEKNYRLWTAGAFGNRLRSWRTVDVWRRSSFRGRVSLRYLGKVGGAFCRFDVLPCDVDGVLREWGAAGAELNRVMVNEGAPDASVVVQGEYMNDILSGAVEAFVYSRVKLKMREALAIARTEVRGLQGRFMLREAMTPSSWEDFNVLLEQYPEHVLEVSVYSRCLGNIPGRNALVWEVRKY